MQNAFKSKERKQSKTRLAVKWLAYINAIFKDFWGLALLNGPCIDMYMFVITLQAQLPGWCMFIGEGGGMREGEEE